MTALKEAETSLTATMALASSAAEDDLTQLTAVYENMKPKEAAQVFAAMDPKFAAGFLGRMRTDAAAAIMAGLEPDTAYAISVLLAGRNAAAPTE
jgi:flagellar motility protein MotE (MotC chaperone)